MFLFFLGMGLGMVVVGAAVRPILRHQDAEIRQLRVIAWDALASARGLAEIRAQLARRHK